MSYHPAYPSTADLRRERDAVERDLADLDTLQRLRAIIDKALTAVRELDELRHPERNWNVSELQETLCGELLNVDGMKSLIQSRVVLELA
jgi:hypothetical protein